VSAFFWAAPALAHPGYPQIVKQVLGVDPAVFDPPQGCQLCHTSDSGGTASLRPFGVKLVSTYGLDPSAATEDDGSLTAALQGLEMGDAQIAQDLKMGMDPNFDVPNDPTPQFGCAAAPPAPERPCPPLVSVALAALVAWAARRRRSIPES
jgi:hypothetical protein